MLVCCWFAVSCDATRRLFSYLYYKRQERGSAYRLCFRSQLSMSCRVSSFAHAVLRAVPVLRLSVISRRVSVIDVFSHSHNVLPCLIIIMICGDQPGFNNRYSCIINSSFFQSLFIHSIIIHSFIHSIIIHSFIHVLID